MADFPALPLLTDAILGDTQHLSAAEFGAYMMALIVAWRSPDCALPNDDKYLARITRAGRSWHRLKPVVMAFWTLGDDGLWRQKRLTKTRLRVTDLVSQRRQAGISSALKRKQCESTSVDFSLNERCNEKQASKTKTKEDKEREAKASPKKTLPADFSLTESRTAYAQEQGVENVAREFANFTDHHRAKGTKHADWDAAWKLWCRRSVEYADQRRAPVNGHGNGQKVNGSLSRAAMAVIEANNRRELRTGGLGGDRDRSSVAGSGERAFETGAAKPDHRGNHPMLALDQEPGEG